MRFTDGPNISPDKMAEAINGLRRGKPARAMFPVIPKESRYGFLFDDLQKDPENLLDPIPRTAKQLIRLGQSMVDKDPFDPKFDSDIPSAYTYLGQLIDHDLTRQSLPETPSFCGTIKPLSSEAISAASNARTFGLDLDCLYGPAIEPNAAYEIPRVEEKLKIEQTAAAPFLPELPRDPESPHAAFIGDRRDDENLMVSQMHLAFMLAHNKLCDQGKTFEEARRTLRQHYQWIVINDYLLKRIADPKIVEDAVNGKLDLFDPPDDDVFMPLEFAVAAFRFGHTMIRQGYNYNQIFPKTELFQLLLPGFLVRYHHFPGEWIIDWSRFLDGTNKARRLDTNLSPGLLQMQDPQGNVMPFGLAAMDLVKGFLMNLPTGEAVAKRLGMEMPAGALRSAITDEQAQILNQGGFDQRTPLWFYILAEANAAGTGRLGQVGSAIVASVIVGLARKSKDSYLRYPDWKPSLGSSGKFDLSDLIKFAGV
jgi:hypothetical protein